MANSWRTVLDSPPRRKRNLDNLVCSSHGGGMTVEANRQASLQVTAEMLRVLRGERPEVLANPEVWPRPAHRR